MIDTALILVLSITFHPIGSVVSLDFDAEGTKIALIDFTGNVVILNVDGDETLQEFASTVGSCTEFRVISLLSIFLAQTSKCRWNPLVLSPIVAVKHARTRLALVDVEKDTRVLNDRLKLLDGISNM